MKLASLCLLTSALLVATSHAQDKPTVKSVTQAHLKASGYDNLSADGMLVIKGTQTPAENGRAGKPSPIRIHQQKDNRIRIEFAMGRRSKGVVIGNGGKGGAFEVYENGKGETKVHKMGLRGPLFKLVAMLADPKHVGKLDQYFDKVELTGTEKVRGKNCHIVTATSKELGQTKFLINSEVGLMRVSCGFLGPKSSMIIELTKWRMVKKVRVPETMEVSMPRERLSCKIVFTDWQLVEKFDMKDFFSVTKPAPGDLFQTK